MYPDHQGTNNVRDQRNQGRKGINVSPVTCGYLLAAADAGPGGHQLRVVLLAHDHAVHHAHAVQDTLRQSRVTRGTDT